MIDLNGGLGVIALGCDIIFNGKYHLVTDDVMMSSASNQVLYNVWSYDFYDMALATK